MYRTAELGDEGMVDRSAVPERPEVRVFQAPTVSAVRTVVAKHAEKAGMDTSRRNDLVLAVNEVAANSVVHAGGWGILAIWRDGESVSARYATAALPAGRRLFRAGPIRTR